jgi:hypothetical protein
MAQDMWLSGFFSGVSLTLSVVSFVVPVIVYFANTKRKKENGSDADR